MKTVAIIKGLTYGAGLMLVLLTVNDYVLRLYDLPGSTNPAAFLWRGDDGTMKGATAFVKRHMAPEDLVIVRQPTWVYWYLGKADHYVKSLNNIPVAVADKAPIPVHRKGGIPYIGNLYELQQVLNNASSAWLIGNHSFGGVDPASLAFITQKTTLVYEDNSVSVYRWKR